MHIADLSNEDPRCINIACDVVYQSPPLLGLGSLSMLQAIGGRLSWQAGRLQVWRAACLVVLWKSSGPRQTQRQLSSSGAACLGARRSPRPSPPQRATRRLTSLHTPMSPVAPRPRAPSLTLPRRALAPAQVSCHGAGNFWASSIPSACMHAHMRQVRGLMAARGNGHLGFQDVCSDVCHVCVPSPSLTLPVTVGSFVH